MASNGRRISIAPPLGCLRIQRILSKGRVFILNLFLRVDCYRMDYRFDLGGHKAATAIAGLSFRTCLLSSTDLSPDH